MKKQIFISGCSQLEKDLIDSAIKEYKKILFRSVDFGGSDVAKIDVINSIIRTVVYE